MWSQTNQSVAAAASAITADLCGQLIGASAAPNVNLNEVLHACRRQIAQLPTSALGQVEMLQPDLINDENMLQFLWAEGFNATNAAKKMARYWDHRYKLFGKEKFMLPITLKGALKDDSVALSRGYVQLLPSTDSAGRAVLFIDWSCHEPSLGYTEDSLVRVFWYMVHCAIEEPSVLQHGIVMIIYPQEARLDQFDHSLWNAVANSLYDVLPVRWRSTHVIHPNRFFSIIHPVFMSSLPQNVQDRVIVHQGTKMKILANLLRYCLPWESIPTEIGGCIQLDFEEWLADRVLKEDSGSSRPPISNITSSLLSAALGRGDCDGAMPRDVLVQFMANGSLPPAVAPALMERNTQQLVPFLPPISASLEDTTPFLPPISAVGDKEGDKEPASAKSGRIIIKSGRKSDPRMDRAMQAKLDDPSMSLLNALKCGGFVFPALDESCTPQHAVVDADNVKITQRKNQLLRRIRMVKKKHHSN